MVQYLKSEKRPTSKRKRSHMKKAEDDVKRVSILFALLACLAGVLSACGGGGGENSHPAVDPLANWHSRNPLPQGNDLSRVTYGKGIFVAVGATGTILTSPDGITWTPNTAGIASYLGGVTYGSGTFVAVGYTGTILTSPDGVTWTSRSSGITADLRGVTYGNGIFVVVGNDYSSTPPVYGPILTSSDGVTWTSRTSGIYSAFLEVTYGNGIFVAVALSEDILTSPDGITWTQQRITRTTANAVTTPIRKTSPGNPPLRGVTYGNGIFVAVGDAGTILTSPDGITWTPRNSGTSYFLSGVTYGEGSFVAVGNIGPPSTWGTILTSPDGVTWISRNSGTTAFLRGVTYGNSTYVAVGDHGTIIQSDRVE